MSKAGSVEGGNKAVQYPHHEEVAIKGSPLTQVTLDIWGPYKGRLQKETKAETQNIQKQQLWRQN